MYTDHNLAKCAERELAMRERVYPRWVEANKMAPRKAEEEIAMMKQIAEHFRTRADRYRLPLAGLGVETKGFSKDVTPQQFGAVASEPRE